MQQVAHPQLGQLLVLPRRFGLSGRLDISCAPLGICCFPCGPGYRGLHVVQLPLQLRCTGLQDR